MRWWIVIVLPIGLMWPASGRAGNDYPGAGGLANPPESACLNAAPSSDACLSLANALLAAPDSALRDLQPTGAYGPGTGNTAIRPTPTPGSSAAPVASPAQLYQSGTQPMGPGVLAGALQLTPVSASSSLAVVLPTATPVGR